MPQLYTVFPPVTGLLVCLLFIPMLITACGEPPEPPPDPEPIEYTVLGRGQNADLPRDFEHEVIRTQEVWETYLQQLHVLNALPEVNFEEEMVLLAARRVNSGGYEIEFEAVERLPDEIEARYVIGVPHDDCMVTMAIATPFQAVRIPQSDIDVRFESQRQVYRCSPRRGLN